MARTGTARILFMGMLVLLSVLLAGSTTQNTASAASHIGLKYFANSPPTGPELRPNGKGNQLYYYGLPPEVRNKPGLINYVLGLYDGTNTAIVQEPRQVGRYHVASAYIIRSMIGSPVGSSKDVTAAEIDEWISRINSPNISLSEEAYPQDRNTGLTTTSLNNIGNQYYDVNQFVSSGNVPSLVFRDSLQNGKIVYGLELWCANPLGELTLPPAINFNLNPSVTGSPPSSEGGGSTATITPNVANGGVTSSTSVEWQLTNFRLQPSVPVVPVPGGATNATAPVSYFRNGATTVASGNRVFNKGNTSVGSGPQVIGDFPVGTRICYALSVRPYNQSTTDWRHGTPFCITIAKSPKLQVRGGDIRVGSNFAGQTLTGTSNITTRQSIKTVSGTRTTFGSWGEYAISATGVIAGIGSGSAFAGAGMPTPTNPLSACSFSFLTFSNARTTSDTCRTTAATNYGKYSTGRTMPTLSNSYPTTMASTSLSGVVNTASLNGIYKTSGDITLNAGVIPAGRTIVINTLYDPVNRQYANVTIAGNITYATGTLTKASDIPQLIIIAGNINIRSAATQVDAWLSAEGTLNTCSNVARTSINSNNCNAVLTFNGPVMANQIQLWRTAGSGPGTLSGNPAEIFNLRPDAYLFGITQSSKSGRLQTVYELELPPRF